MKDKIDDLIKIDEQYDEQINKQIIKGTNRKIIKTNLKLLLGLIIILCIISFIMQLLFYNPLKKANYHVNDDPQAYQPYEYEILMSVNFGLTLPGKSFELVDGHYYGFGYYSLNAKITDWLDYYVAGNFNLDEMSMFLGQTKFGNDYPIYFMNIFDLPNEDGYYQSYLVEYYNNDKQEILEELHELPKSSKLDIYLTFNSAMSFEDLFVKYPIENLIWIYCDQIANNYYGINVHDRLGYVFTNEFNNEFPGIQPFYGQEMAADYLKQRYISSIRYLLANKQFMRTNQGYNNYISPNRLTELLHNSENIVEAKGIRMYVSRDELIDIISDDNSYYVYIDDVKYSSFENGFR